MNRTGQARTLGWKIMERLKAWLWRLRDLYHPDSLKQKGWLGSAVVLLLTGLVGWYWSQEPDALDVQSIARQQVDGDTTRPVAGMVYTGTLIEIGGVLLDKPGGYISNDVMPPGVWLDNISNWEYGALLMLRDGAAALRNHMSRSQSQSVEDADLAEAEPRFNFRNDSWMLPGTEREYRKALQALGAYRQRLGGTGERQAQFFARADNLRQYLEIIEKRLGSLSQRLSASVGQVQVNADLLGDDGASPTGELPVAVTVKTPWLQLDDVFYEARGATWALRAILQAVEYDFADVLRKKNALVSLRQIIRELDESQQPKLSPVVLNGSGFGLFANYSLTMANYVARANAAIIDLRELLQRG
jgi:hypothetical protein